MTHIGKNYSYLLPVDSTNDKPSTRFDAKHLVRNVMPSNTDLDPRLVV
jgi:hypothetical protein